MAIIFWIAGTITLVGAIIFFWLGCLKYHLVKQNKAAQAGRWSYTFGVENKTGTPFVVLTVYPDGELSSNLLLATREMEVMVDSEERPIRYCKNPSGGVYFQMILKARLRGDVIPYNNVRSQL